LRLKPLDFGPDIVMLICRFLAGGYPALQGVKLTVVAGILKSFRDILFEGRP
jgi:hypothetical protein